MIFYNIEVVWKGVLWDMWQKYRKYEFKRYVIHKPRITSHMTLKLIFCVTCPISFHNTHLIKPHHIQHKEQTRLLMKIHHHLFIYLFTYLFIFDLYWLLWRHLILNSELLFPLLFHVFGASPWLLRPMKVSTSCEFYFSCYIVAYVFTISFPYLTQSVRLPVEP